MSADIKALSDPLPIAIINIKDVLPNVDTNFVSDGYHTFGELYEHRIVNYMALCKAISDIRNVWMSKAHSDGSIWDGWFILGINDAGGEQITYHLPEYKWDECTKFTQVVDSAPEYDGHTSEDVLERLSRI